MPEPGTYQTRISDYRDVDRLDGDATLAAYGELYGRVQRKLFAAFAAGRSVTSLEGGVPAGVRDPGADVQRVRVSLEGKIASVREAQKLHRDTLQRRIARAERQISDAWEQSRWQQVHQKRRRLGNLQSKLAGLEADSRQGEYGFVSGQSGCGASSITWRPTGMPAMRNGWPIGGVPAAASSSCWAAGMRPAAASCVWRRLLTMAPWPCGSGLPVREAWQISGDQRRQVRPWP